ncbi:MAG: heat shock protein DnaJ domain protein [Frankiales bacterium]|nr:heat shock protein DnaJ domain protein [Frankiales bacterium]
MSDYPASLDVRPLTTWPGTLTPAHRRSRSNFSAPLGATLDVLTRELNALGARHPVLEVAIPADQFRLDGRPRANAREDHPGVVLSLPHTTVGALRYATDTFDRWRDNLRAIALGLEALRKVDRYGITKRGEQYAGFKALPSGIAMPSAAAVQMTVDEAARALLQLAAENGFTVHRDEILTNTDGLRDRAYRHIARYVHPDTGGDRAIWDRLEQAKHVLDQHTGGDRG